MTFAQAEVNLNEAENSADHSPNLSSQPFDILDYEQTIMGILLAWGLGSIVIGGVITRRTQGRWRGFGEQTFGWGLIDALLALNGLRGRDKLLAQGEAFSAERAFKRARFLRGLLAFNAGLDVLYLLGGWRLTRHKEVRLQGWGWGILSQALFLLMFDSLAAYFIRPKAPK